jgi:hypothetical protein
MTNGFAWQIRDGSITPSRRSYPFHDPDNYLRWSVSACSRYRCFLMLHVVRSPDCLRNRLAGNLRLDIDTRSLNRLVSISFLQKTWNSLGSTWYTISDRLFHHSLRIQRILVILYRKFPQHWIFSLDRVLDGGSFIDHRIGQYRDRQEDEFEAESRLRCDWWRWGRWMIWRSRNDFSFSTWCKFVQ